MRRVQLWLVLCGMLVPASLIGQPPPPRPQPQSATQPKMRIEPIAETRLLMEGLALANLRGLDQQLRQKPSELEAWVFARGQALLIAETGNLLLLRPPRSQGQEAWVAYASQLRETGTRLARAAADRDYERSKAGLVEVTNVCNRCHQTFRVPVRMPPKE